MSRFLTTLFVVLSLNIYLERIYAQSDSTFVKLPDSVKSKEHSPSKAALMSACLPGLGQAYNQKYWKIPVIYAGLGVMGYFIYFNADLYREYKGAYIESTGGITDGKYHDLVNKYTAENLLSAREYYRRNLEVTCLITALWYTLNILDAAVDAHLFTYNISEDLSLKVEPQMVTGGYAHRPSAGIKLKINF